jgi:hypothetical protein
MQNYQYLWQGKSEVILQQLLLDPLQDSLIKKLTLALIATSQHSHCHHCHGHGQAQSFLAELMQEFIFHFGIKAVATVSFPIIYLVKPQDLAHDSLSGLLSFGQQAVKFFGINPLEGVYALHSMIENALGADNIITNNAITAYFSNDYVSSRTTDQDYGHFMDNYRIYMEGFDAAIHATDNIMVLAQSFNHDLNQNIIVTTKAAGLFGGLLMLKSHTDFKQDGIDQEIYHNSTRLVEIAGQQVEQVMEN